MIRWAVPFVPILVLGCSDVTEGAGGVVAIEITAPSPNTVEVGETLQLSARALDKDGNPVSVPISWFAADATLTVDANGAITGVSPGTGRVQALTGTLPSPFVSFSVIAPADTLIVVGDSVVTVGPGIASSTPLVTRLESFNPAGAVGQRPVVYEIMSPTDNSVALSEGVLIDTLSTGSDGTVQTAILNRVNVAQPGTAIVEIRASRTRGAAVPGSGQRFTVNFQ